VKLGIQIISDTDPNRVSSWAEFCYALGAKRIVRVITHWDLYSGKVLDSHYEYWWKNPFRNDYDGGFWDVECQIIRMRAKQMGEDLDQQLIGSLVGELA